MPQTTAPNKLVPGEGPESVQVFLVQNYPDNEPEVHVWAANGNDEFWMTLHEVRAFAYSLHEVITTADPVAKELLPD